MKTAISVPNDVFEEADRLAERLGKTRSQLYTEAMIEFLSRHDPDTVTKQLNEVWDSVSETGDHFVTETSRRILERVEWCFGSERCGGPAFRSHRVPGPTFGAPSSSFKEIASTAAGSQPQSASR